MFCGLLLSSSQFIVRLASTSSCPHPPPVTVAVIVRLFCINCTRPSSAMSAQSSHLVVLFLSCLASLCPFSLVSAAITTNPSQYCLSDLTTCKLTIKFPQNANTPYTSESISGT